jgi:lipopolysaccharide transport system ATP-binding protein
MLKIVLRDLHVTFPVFEHSANFITKSFLEYLHPGNIFFSKALNRKSFEALKGIDVTINDGDYVGLIGSNGAGKSTLLKCIAGVYPPTSGSLSVEAQSVCSIFSASMGIDPESNGIENIWLVSLLQGRSINEIRLAVPDIISFADIGEAVYRPVKTYSAGMLARLMFGISTAYAADVLLLDEVLSVGDLNFRDKAAERIASLIGRSHIVIHAIHDVSVLQKSCTRVIWLENGCVRGDGLPSKVISDYLSNSNVN